MAIFFCLPQKKIPTNALIMLQVKGEKPPPATRGLVASEGGDEEEGGGGEEGEGEEGELQDLVPRTDIR